MTVGIDGDPALLAPTAPTGLQRGPRPSFGVVIAAYQAAGTVASAVRSVLEQTQPPAELVVADDGSTDDLDGALAPFGEAVRLVRIEHAGESAAKNAGAATLTTPWIVFLDADDSWLPTRLARMGDLAAARPDLDVLSTDAWFVRDARRRGRFHGLHHRFPVTDQATELLRRNWLFTGVAVRRAAWDRIGGFDVDVPQGADWHCWLRLVLSGSVAGCVDEPLADYTIHESSMSADRPASLLGRVDVLDRVARAHALDDRQRRAMTVMRRESLSRARLAELEQALLEDGPVRAASWRYATCPGLALRRRARGFAVLLSPSLGRRRLQQHIAVSGRTHSSRGAGTS
jgi:hypothetical protein